MFRHPPASGMLIRYASDRIADQIRQTVGKHLTLPQILEAATWKGGREIAKELRGDAGGGPPIEIESDGTVF
jgi:hypothetical protein